MNQGGLQVVAHGGETDFAIINRGSQYLKGVSYFSELMNGGTETVATFGHALYTKIDAGSLQDVQDQGRADFTEVMSGGKQIVELGGYVDNTSVHAGGVQVVNYYGGADHTNVALQGIQDSFGWSNYSEVYGLQKIENGGIDHWAEIHGGGIQKIFEGGSATGTIVDQGAHQYVAGEADYTWLYGYEKVWQDGHTVSTEIQSGGKEVVDGSALWSFIGSGGQLVVESGGVANQTGIDTDGLERVLSGGIELQAIFKGAGTLDLDSANCVGLIEGWQAGARVDLRDIAFGPNSTLGYDSLSGILSISDGQHTSYLHFLNPTGVFNASSDGHGGTLITDAVPKPS